MHYPFSLPSLPYSYEALSPNLDSRTLAYHHDKHFAAYIERLNALLAPYPEYHSWSLTRLCTSWPELPEEIRQGVRHSAGGVYNHGEYFLCMSPVGTTSPTDEFSAAVNRDFSSESGLKAAIKSAAMSIVGSGWVWLLCDQNGTLRLQTVSNQDTPLPALTLACIDMWEHAYYLQYQNRKGEYVDNFLPLLNWRRISERYAELKNFTPPYPLG